MMLPVGFGRRSVHAVLIVLSTICAQPGDATETAGVDKTSPAYAMTLRAQGERIFREGVRPSGLPLTGLGAAQMTLSGKDAACQACHRRSGYGTSEGTITIRPIIGPALLQQSDQAIRSPRIRARLGSAVRPAYTEALLGRALRVGVDSAGKNLDRTMPRFDLSDAEVQAMAAYLFSLASEPSPGVSDEEIHFATVIEPGVSTEKRRAMLDVMQRFVRDKDSNMRGEVQRRRAGNMRMYRAYRKWVLHVWELTGKREDWVSQLETFYRQQPVFALVGGLGTSHWDSIQNFSERMGIPSILPQVDLPAQADTNYYTIYFSRGVMLEAEVLAHFMREQRPAGPIVQVYRPGNAGATAAGEFLARMRAGGAEKIQNIELEGDPDAAFWERVARARPAALLIWLDAKDMTQATLPRVPAYLSFQLTGGQIPEKVREQQVDVRLIYPSDLPPNHEARLLRGKHWLIAKGLGLTDEVVQINTLFAMAVVSDVVGHMADSFSRDYFVERVEHMVAQTPLPSIYPRMSLGPGQRHAAKGARIVQLAQGDGAMKSLSGWIVP